MSWAVWFNCVVSEDLPRGPPPGQRVVEAVPQGCWQMTTLIGALRRDGATAALVFDGATDAAAFESFLGQTPCPTLRPGDLVVMDRLQAASSFRCPADTRGPDQSDGRRAARGRRQ